jgi:hypothetical protein
MALTFFVAGGLAIAVICVGTFLFLVTKTLNRAFLSIPVCPPVRPSDTSRCVLFKYIPDLRGRVAWTDLGASFPTPVHHAQLKTPSPGGGAGQRSRTVYLKVWLLASARTVWRCDLLAVCLYVSCSART